MVVYKKDEFLVMYIFKPTAILGDSHKYGFFEILYFSLFLGILKYLKIW